MTKRKKLPDDTVESGVVPLTRRKAPNQVASSPSSGRLRRATATAPAIGANSSSRALQKYSRRWLKLSWRFAQSRSTYRSTDDRLTATAGPAASRASSNANAGSVPSPRCFQIASVSSAGSKARPNGSSGRRLRASSAATTGAAMKRPFDGLTPTAKPTTSPAATASSGARVSSARTKNRAPTSSSTIDW